MTARGADFLAQAVLHEQKMPFISVDLGHRKLFLAVPNQKCLGFAQTIFRREPMTLRWIQHFGADETLFDIGANNGIYGLLAACMTECRVVAFEPHYASYYVTMRNVFANKLQDRVLAYPLALSDGPGYGRIFLSALTAGKSLNQYGAEHPSDDPLWNATIPQGCTTTSVDCFVELSGIAPTHLKIDVDGLEDRIVAGAAGVLASGSVRSLLVETTGHDDRDRSVAEAVEASGFSFVRSEEGNTIWARPDFAASLSF